MCEIFWTKWPWMYMYFIVLNQGILTNWLRLRDAHTPQWTVPSLGQVMARCLLDTKQLPKPMLTFCWLDPWINFNKIWIKIQKFSMKENEIVICKIMATCFSASMHSKQPWRALTWAYGQQIIQCWKVPSSFDKTLSVRNANVTEILLNLFRL